MAADVVLRTIFSSTARADKKTILPGNARGTYFVKTRRIHANNDSGDKGATPIARSYCPGTAWMTEEALAKYPNLLVSYIRQLPRHVRGTPIPGAYLSLRTLDTAPEVQYSYEHFWRIETDAGSVYVQRYATTAPALQGTDFCECGASVEPIAMWPDNIGPWEKTTFAQKITIQDPVRAAETLGLPIPLRPGLVVIAPECESTLASVRIPVAASQAHSCPQIALSWADDKTGTPVWWRHYSLNEIMPDDIPAAECFGAYLIHAWFDSGHLKTLFRKSNNLDGLIRADLIGQRASEPEEFTVFDWSTRRLHKHRYCFVTDVEKIAKVDDAAIAAEKRDIATAFKKHKHLLSSLDCLTRDALDRGAEYARAKNNGWVPGKTVLRRLGISAKFGKAMLHAMFRNNPWGESMHWPGDSAFKFPALYNPKVICDDLFVLRKMQEFYETPHIVRWIADLRIENGLDPTFTDGVSSCTVNEIGESIDFRPGIVRRWLRDVSGQSRRELWPRSVIESPPNTRCLLKIALGQKDAGFVIRLLRDKPKCTSLLMAMLVA